MENKYYSKSNLVAAFFIGLLVGLGGYYLVDNSDVVKITKKTVDKEDGGKMEVVESGDVVKDIDIKTGDFDNSISVNDQPAGLKVDIISVTISKDGWAVVHENTDGVPGNILGAQRFDAGTWDGSIDLLRNTEEGNMYYVMLHIDNGDKEFDHKKDLPILEGGSPVMATFNAVRIR